MIDWLVNKIFAIKPLREALFAEVNFHNSMTRIMNDPESMKTAAAFWDEGDGWRGWVVKENKYYFHDIPEKSLSDVMEAADGRS